MGGYSERPQTGLKGASIPLRLLFIADSKEYSNTILINFGKWLKSGLYAGTMFALNGHDILSKKLS